MTSVNQQIPNLIGGISVQPDELKLPGQARDVVNALPNVSFGLTKRPGGWLVNPVYDQVDGSWFTMYYSETESYIGNISPGGFVRIWDSYYGLPVPVVTRETPYIKKPANRYEDLANQPLKPEPQFQNCDIRAFKAAKDQFQGDAAQISILSEEIQDLRDQLEETQNKGTNYYQLGVFEKYRSGYIIKQGYAESDSKFAKDSLEFDRPAGAEKGNLYKRGVEVYTLQDGRGGSDPSYRIVYAGNDGWDLYQWKVPVNDETPADPGEIAAIQAQIDQKTAELNALKQAAGPGFEQYKAQAEACGVWADPGSDTRSTENEWWVGKVPYFEHKKSDDIQTLTIADTTFVVNRNVKTSMSDRKVDDRPYYAFIELTTIAYNKQYALDIGSAMEPGLTETQTRATKIEVVTSDWVDKDGDCQYTDTKIFDVTGDDLIGTHGNPETRQNLRFELETRGQSVPKDPEDARKGYDCEYTTRARLLFGGEGWLPEDTVQVEMSGKTYNVMIKDVQESETNAVLAAIRPPATISNADQVLSAESILQGILDEFDAEAPWITTQRIGNGIYIESEVPFIISTTEGQLMSLMTTVVTNVSRLPDQCKDGYIVKVENSENDEDDYYLEFHGSLIAQDGEGEPIDGAGYWEEVALPGLFHTFNPGSMPHQIVLLDDGVFLVAPVQWEDRLVGDDTTNPLPSFVGYPITKAIFFKNRLGLLSRENVVLSQPGEYFNFFAKTAMTVSPADPIDISCASDNPADLYDTLEVNSGLMLFSNNGQYMLTTEADEFTPLTAKINKLAEFRYNTKTHPMSFGTTVGFVTSVPRSSRLYEVLNPERFADTDVVDISMPIQGLMPATINSACYSNQNSFVALGTACQGDLEKGKDEIWVYKYYTNGQKRELSSWVRWKLTGKLVYMTTIGDEVVMVLANKSDSPIEGDPIICTIQKFNLRDSPYYVTDDEDIQYNIHMDNFRVVLPTDLQYYPHLDQTYFRIPLGYYSDKQLVAYALGNAGTDMGYEHEGHMVYPEIEVDNLGTWVVLPGNWDNTRVALGYEFEMSVDLPTFFLRKESGDKIRSDTRSSLVIHRAQISLGRNGFYETTLKRRGKDDYTAYYESRLMDGYNADKPAVDPFDFQSVAIYERNTNVNLTIKSSHPTPATIHSVTWEGDYNDMFYRRV